MDHYMAIYVVSYFDDYDSFCMQFRVNKKACI